MTVPEPSGLTSKMLLATALLYLVLAAASAATRQPLSDEGEPFLSKDLLGEWGQADTRRRRETGET